MAKKTLFSELDRALARPDVAEITSIANAYERYFHETDGNGEWPDEWSEKFGDMMFWPQDDPDKALAFVVIGAARMTHAGCVGILACGPLEDLLREPTDEMVARIVAEARKSSRFRWLLSHPFKVAVSEKAWRAIEKFRITGPHEEPPSDTMPASYFA